MKIGLIQMEVIPGEAAINRRKALTMLEEAVRQGCQLMVLPEMWTIGYALKNVNDFAEDLQGESLAALREFARARGVEVIAGSLPVKEEGKIYNNAFALDHSGDIVAAYRKIHLFSLLGEERFFTPGDSPALFELSFGKAGLIICYDLRFPELSRMLAVKGAKALFVPAQWPGARRDHWPALNIARAIENQMYVIAVNCVGQHKQNVFHGHSLIVDPWGQVLLEGDDREAVLTQEIDWAMVGDVRAKMSVFADRRTDVYQC